MANGTYRALLIGNSSFPDDPHNLQALAGPVNDVATLRAALCDDDVGLFGSDQVRLVAERTVHEVRVELERFFSAARRDDTLFLFYSGHGVLDQRNQLFLCARDTRTDLLKSTAVGASEISLMFEESAARTTVIVLDCCHSGAFKSGQIADSLRGTGRYLLTSARSRELAADATTENATSVFTHHLVEGLRAGARDSDHDGFTDLGDLYDYVYGRLSEEGRQIPQRSFEGGGVVPIARRTAPATAPAPVVEASEPAGKPLLELSTTMIDLGTVRAGQPLRDEQVFVLNDGGGRLDWVARTEEDWIEIEPHLDFFKLSVQPHPGLNQGRVVVHDRAAGATKIVRVTVRVVEEPRPEPRPSPRGEPRVAPSPQSRPTPPPAPARPGPGPSRQTATPRWVRPTVAAAAAAVVVIAVALALSGGGGGGGDVVRTVTVRGDRAFTSTGIDLEPGDAVTITAEGTVLHAAESNLGAGPDGDASAGVLPSNVIDDMNHGGLIGRIGDDGVPFRVGSSRQFESPLRGELFLGVNDTGVANNAGEFTARVQVERA